LPINAMQNTAEENVEMTQEPLKDSFSNKPIKLTYPHFDKNIPISKPKKLKRTIGTVGTSIAIEIPSKKVKDDSNSNSAEGIITIGKISYSQLITEALKNAPDGELVISDIYKAINLKHPQYKLEDLHWQNSVSGTISSNQDFVKGKKVKAGWNTECVLQYWKLSENHEEKFQNSDDTKDGNFEKMNKDN
jgi:hypothetical protein